MEVSGVVSNLQYELEGCRRRIGGLEAKANEAAELGDKVYQYEARFSQMGLKMQSY